MAVPFQFDAASHVYTVDGAAVPSVTQVLEGVGISDFSMVPRDRLRYAQELGTAVHDATDAYDRDDLERSSVAGTVVEPYLDGWALFRRESGFTPRSIEHRGIAQVGGQRYGFAFDREGEHLGFPTVLDIKTGARSRSWRLQLAAYELALFLLDGQHRRRVVVRLLDDGTYRTITFGDRTDEAAWRWALALETWKRNNA